MAHTPIDQNASPERQEVINWLISHNYPALPVAPAQSVWKYHKVAPEKPELLRWSHCPLTADLQPIPLYIGKNPSYLDRTGIPHLINHRKYQKRLPKKHELEDWFANPCNGVGTLGGWNNTVWLDFDVKQFPSQEECDAAVLKILERPQGVAGRDSVLLQETFIERSHSGGWRIGVKVKHKPDFTNFSLTPGGAHVGEALFKGRFTVLAPTIGASGNPYQSIQRVTPIEVESMESIGIYSTKHKGTGDWGLGTRERRHSDVKTKLSASSSQSPLPGCIPLEMLGSDTSRDILHGVSQTGDRSFALTTATKEWYGWQTWALGNGIPISGDATTLAHYAGTQLGLDSDRINRILISINDPTSFLPAALYRGGEESCWKKIYRLSKATFEAKCPVHIKEVIVETFRKELSTGHGSGNGSGDGGRLPRGGYKSGNEDNSKDNENRVKRAMVVKSLGQKSQYFAAIRNQIKDILIQDLPPSELQTAKIRIRIAFPEISEREISRLFETLEQELEQEESRSEIRSEVDNLLRLGDQSLNLSEFIPTDLAEPLTQLSRELNIRPEVCLTSLLVAASSLHKTPTELVLHRGQGFSVPPTIFAGLVSESGQKKSPIFKAIIKKPLSVLQREKRVAYSLALAQYEKDSSDWDRCKSEERSSKFPEGKPKLPQQRLYYFTNATGEGLLYQFQAHPDKALLALVDELVGLFASQNKYSGGRGSDRQDILSAFDGTGATVLRAAGTKADLDGVLLSICGTIQPEILKRLMRDCSDPDGQWARFLFVNQPLAAATLVDDDGSCVDLTGRLLNYYRAIDRLPGREYKLSREAFKRYQPIYNQLERLRVSHPSPGMRAVYSKMEGYIGRLALNLHILHELAAGKTLPDEEIPLHRLDCAIALAKFYIGQVKLIHANSSAELGEIAPHLAKIVELSKRMDATTGNSWIKAKVVLMGYCFRYRPRPDAIRSWFRELEALGIGATRGTGIRLEYSWKLPDLPIDESDPPPKQKVEKSGEKWITSPPTEPTQKQDSREKEEKVDNPTLTSLNWGVSEQTSNVVERSCLTPMDSSPSPISNPLIASEATPDKSWIQSPVGEDGRFKTKNSLGITHSTSPLSGCDDGVEQKETVDTQSTFSPPADSVSTIQECEEPEGKIPRDEATLVTTLRKSLENIQEGIVLRVFPLNQRKESRDSHSADTGVEVEWKVVINTTAFLQNLAISNSVSESIAGRASVQAGRDSAQAAPQEKVGGQPPTKYHQVLVTVEELKSPLFLQSLRNKNVAVAMFIELASGHKNQGESTDTGTKALPLLALVAIAIQGYCLSLVSRSGDLPNPHVAAEPPAAAEPQATETDDKVDRFKEGERVYWTNCPVCCEDLAPFAIMWIECEYAKLELFSNLVPLSELLRPD